MTACGKKWRLLCSFTSLWEFKDLLFSSPILRISICCFHSSSLQLRDSQDLAVAASKVLIDTGFQVRRHEEVEMRIRSCVYAWMCVLEGGGWLGIDSFRMLWALERVFHTHARTDTASAYTNYCDFDWIWFVNGWWGERLFPYRY